MLIKIHRISFLALLALSTIALAADGFTVGWKPKEGDAYRYTMKADLDLGGNPIPLTATLTEKITKVETDGSYTVESSQIEGKVSLNGKEQDIPNGSPTSIIFKASGEVSKVVGDASAATPNSYRMANLSMIFDPGKPVAVGDAWFHEIKPDAATGAVGIRADYKLIGEEKIGAIDTLKIKATLKETTGDVPGSSDETVWVDKANGSTVKIEAKWVNAPVPGTLSPVSATVKIDRVG